MHHFDAHELADSWELRAGLLDEDPADASISACLRECAAALRNIATPSPAPAQGEAACRHDWEPESRANGWRETCRLCGAQAQGSGQ